MLIPFSSYALESTASSQRLVNCYAEKAPDGAKGPLILRRSPGIRMLGSVGSGPGRGLCVMAGSLYAVSGNTLYRVSQSGIGTSLGTVPGTGIVSMAATGTEIVLNTAQVWNGTLSAIGGDFQAGGKLAFLDSYILATDPNTGRFRSSQVGDVTDWDALYFATAEGAPDDVLDIQVDHRQAVLIGAGSTELWENVGGSGFPFVRSINGFVEIGGAGQFASTKQDQSVHWLANDKTLRRLSGNTAVRTSQHGMERAVRAYSRTDNCQMFSYTLDGHLCVVVRFPDLGTWIYDCTTQEIHERQTYGRLDWDVSGFAEVYGKVYVQRASDGAIGVLDATCYTEWGNDLVSSWTYQNLYGGGQRITLDHLELGMETGVTSSTTAPSISLEMSYDGGKTYQALPKRTFGAVGEYRERVKWDRLGSGFDLVVRMSTSDAVPLTIWDTQAVVR